MSLNHFYPAIDDGPLKERFVGKHLHEVDPPAAILDLALIRKSCNAMLESSRQIGVSFRAHVKSHKTIELTRLQVGEEGPVKLIASTVAEIEFLVPYLLECKAKGREIDILYGMPTPPSTIKRLVQISGALASPSKPAITLLIDSVEGIEAFEKETRNSNTIFNIMVKIDTGYHRSGVLTEAPEYQITLPFLLDQIKTAEAETKTCIFTGFYSHRGDSYSGSTPSDALVYLRSEIDGLQVAANIAKTKGWNNQLSLSLGATPTATAIQYILSASNAETDALRTLIDAISTEHDLEVHAGVYPILDLQQVATHARPTSFDDPNPAVQPLDTSHIAIRLLVEVASIYTDRPEVQVLIAAGTLALGREPCKSYPGWGIVTPWLDPSLDTYTITQAVEENAPRELHISSAVYDEVRKTGWIVEKISQEHGILGWQGDATKSSVLSEVAPGESKIDKRTFKVGEKLMIWPNHACVTGACFGYYLVVDSEGTDGVDKIVDVWVRARGW